MAFRIVLYTKEGCTLCSETRAILERLKGEFALDVTEVDITSEPELHERFKNVIPVIAIEGRATLLAPISEFRLRRALED